VSTRRGGLEHLGTLDEDPELGAAAGAHQQRGRRGEAECARAGDDQHGDGGGERACWVGARAEPERERPRGERDDDRHEHPGDPVGEALGLGLAVLRLLDEAPHLSELGVGSDPGGPHDQSAARVDRRPDDRVAGPDLHRHRLTGEHGDVDRGPALRHHAVRGDLLAGPDDEPVADRELPDRHPDLDTAAQDGDVLRAEFEQGAQRGAGKPLGARLEVAPGEDEGGDAGGYFEVDVPGAVTRLDGELEGVRHARHTGGAEQQCPQRPRERGEHAERHQGVHGRGAVPEVGPGGAVEGPSSPDDDRCGEGEGDPLPVVELQGRDHRHGDDRNCQRGAAEQAVAQHPRCIRISSLDGSDLGGRWSRQPGGVAGGLDLGEQHRGVDAIRGVHPAFSVA
jgi:hypothetical protein